MAYKVDPLRGMNPDQSGPKEKIQNGDPKSDPAHDQRSGAAESGGPGPSLQKGPTGTEEGKVPPQEDLVLTNRFDYIPDANLPRLDEQERVAAYDRAGEGDLVDGRLKDRIPGDAYAGPNQGSMIPAEEVEDKVAGGPEPKNQGDDKPKKGNATTK